MEEGTPTVTLRELEQLWRPRIEGVSLLAELEVDRQGIEDALSLVGREWKTWGAMRATKRLRASFPAVYALGLSGAASMHYEGGSLWPSIFDAMHLRYDANDANAMGRLFEECVAVLGLTTFPELDQERATRFVSRILLHAGVPLYCIDDWVNALEDISGRLGADDSELIFERLNGRARANRLFHVDKPVQRFIKFGGDYALDFLDRSIDLIRAVQSSDGTLTSFGLPQRFVDRTIEVLKDRTVETPRRQVRQTQRASRSHLAFDAYGFGVHLVLPPVRSEGAANWRIRMDEDERTLVAHATSSGTTEPLEVPIPLGVGHVEVEGPAPSTQFRIEDGKAPLLLFDEHGVAVPASGHVRTTKVWAVYPSEQELEDAGQRILERLPSVHRWDGWSATKLDLSDAVSIGLVDGRRRAIDHTSKPSVLTPPLAHVRTMENEDVFATWPVLQLPPTHGVPWTVSVAIDGADVGTRHTTDVEADTTTTFDTADLVGDGGGRATITVRGPLGRGLRTTIGVAPGLHVRCIPRWRSFADRGLSPATVQVTHPNGRKDHVELGERDVDVQLHVETSTALLPVVVRPPAMASQLVTDGDPVQWSHATRYLSTEDLTEGHAQLVVRFDPDGPAPQLEVVGPNGQSLQTVEAGATRSGGTTSFDLRRISDTVAQHPACVLVLTGGGRRDRVAVLRPRVLAHGVDLRPDGYGLQVLVPQTTGLQVGVYRHLDPTADPVVLDVSGDGMALLPDELVGAGTLRAALRVDDPWSPQPWSRFPWIGPNVFDVIAPMPVAVSGTVPKLLLDHTPPPPDPSELASAIELYPLLDRLLDDDQAYRVRQAIRATTNKEPGVTARALGRTLTSGSDIAFGAVNLGAVNRPLGHFSPDEIESLLDRWAPLGVAAAVPHLRSNERAWIADVIADHVGTAFCDLLEGHGDAALARPVLEDEKLITLPDEFLDMAFRAAGIVPSPLLDDDTQALAGRRLLVAIRDNDPRIMPLQKDWENHVGSILATVLEPHAPVRLTTGVRRRIQGGGWQVAPAASLALAAVARLDARRAVEDSRLRNGWRFALGRLARTVPNLVAADLVMAEAVLLSEE